MYNRDKISDLDIARLHKISITKEHEEKDIAKSLVYHYLNKGRFSKQQHRLAKAIIRQFEVEVKDGCYCVYGIKLDGAFKVGMSKNVKRRIKSFETSNVTVKLIGLIYVDSKDEAYRLEKQLHKELRSYRLERELFAQGAIAKFKAACFRQGEICAV